MESLTYHALGGLLQDEAAVETLSSSNMNRQTRTLFKREATSHTRRNTMHAFFQHIARR